MIKYLAKRGGAKVPVASRRARSLARRLRMWTR